MAHRQTKLERLSEGSFPHWVALIDEKCTGANCEKIREFRGQRGLMLSRFDHSVVWRRNGIRSFASERRGMPRRS